MISDTAIRNRSTVLVLVILILIGGAAAYVTLPREAAPDVPIPYVLINTTYSGVAPQDVENAVTMKIEKKLSGLKGLKEVRSVSAEGQSTVVVEFLPNLRIEEALQSVRDKVDQAKGDLPTDSVDFKEPVITEINVAEFPIVIVNISGPISPVRLKAIAEELQDRIEEVPGVLGADLEGALEREIRLEIDPDRVAAYGLTIPELLKLIPAEHVNVSAGGLDTAGTKFNVRVPSEFASPDEVDHWPLTERGGRMIYLSDVAQVADSFKDRQTYSRLDGQNTITLSIRKRVGENIVSIAAVVKAILTEAQKRVPQGVSFALTLDRSRDIQTMVSDLENNLFAAFVLVGVILLVFMGWRASLVVALAVPLSMLMSFAVIQMLGYTLNMIVLFSLVLAVGMLVDNAIVIVENVYRHMQLGYGRIEAAMKGTSEVAWPVITSTLTTVAAFVPMFFWPGIVGNFMSYLPITVSIVLLCSLLVAMVISPVVCTVLVPHVRQGRRDNWFYRAYRRFLGLALSHRFATLGLTVLLLAGLGLVYRRLSPGVEFFPDIDPKRGTVDIRLPQGTNIRKTDQLARQVEQRVESMDKSSGDLDHLITGVGSASGLAALFGQGASGPHMADLTLLFKDYEDRPRPSAKAVEEIRAALRDLPGAEVKVEKEREGPPTGAPVAVRIVGKDFAALEELSDQAETLIAEVPGLVNLRSDLEAARPELSFRVDRQRAAMLGVSSFTVGNFLKTALFGSKVGSFRQYNDEYDITVRLPEAQRTHFQDLLRLEMPNNAGQSIPLSSVGTFQYRGGLGTIQRVDQKRVVTLTADNEGRLAEDVLADVRESLSPIGRASLRPADIADWPAFLKALRGEEPPLLGRLRQRLPERVRRLIEQAGPGHPLREPDRREILDAVNAEVLTDPGLSRSGLDRLALSEEARQLAGQVLPRFDLSWGQRLLSWWPGVGPSQQDRQRLGRLNRLALESALPGLIAHAGRLDLPEDYEIRYAGQKEEMEKAKAFLSNAFAIALLLIVLILVAQFNTLTVPLIIMTTVVMSLIGVLIGLIAYHMPFGVIMTGIGVISLAGVVVNNAIVLLDYTRKLQARGMDLVAASVEAGATRLRPVLLTAGTTVIGLLPTLLGQGFDVHSFQWVSRSESSLWWKSMAVAVVFGLSFATMLTLVFVPTLYVSVYRLAAKLGLGGLRKTQAPQPQSLPAPAA